MLDIAGDVGMSVDVVVNLQAGVLAACGPAEDAGELLRIDVERPGEVVQVVARILSDEKGSAEGGDTGPPERLVKQMHTSG